MNRPLTLDVGAPEPAGARIMNAVAQRVPGLEDLEITLDYGRRSVELTGKRDGEAFTVSIDEARSIDDAVAQICAALEARAR